MKIGIAISTYANENTSDERIDIIRTCIESVIAAKHDNDVMCIIDDCSCNKKHSELLKSFENDIMIIYRENNGGVAKCKNSAIQYLMENKIDFGFLLDDDMIIKDSEYTNIWYDAYKKTGIHHFNYCGRLFNLDLLDPITNNLMEKFIFKKNNIKFVNTPRLNGCFLTITPTMIEKIGYFRVFPFKYGHSHTNFTLRAIEAGFTDIYGFIDLYDSEKYIGFNLGATKYFANPTIDRFAESSWNGQFYKLDLDKYVPIII